MHGDWVLLFMHRNGVVLFAGFKPNAVLIQQPIYFVSSAFAIALRESITVSRQLLGNKHCHQFTVSKKKRAKKLPSQETGRKMGITSSGPVYDGSNP